MVAMDTIDERLDFDGRDDVVRKIQKLKNLLRFFLLPTKIVSNVWERRSRRERGRRRKGRE